MSSATLLTLPRELRDEICSHLLLPPQMYPATAPKNQYSPERLSKPPPTYIDHSVFLPARYPLNLLHTCQQLRAECTQTLIDAANSTPKRARLRQHHIRLKHEGHGAVNAEVGNRLLEAEFWPQITMAVLQHTRASFGGWVIPERTALSPTFLSLLPIMQHIRQLQFAIWPGWEWWEGPKRKRVSGLPNLKTLRAHRVAASPDQIYEQPKSKPELITQPDVLGVAVETVLARLPCVQDVEIDVLLHLNDYWNWDLPDKKWEQVYGWLDGPVEKGGDRRWKRVKRQLMVVNFAAECWHIPFYRKVEVWEEGVGGEAMVSEGKGRSVDVVEELTQISEEWDEAASKYMKGEADEIRKYTRLDTTV